MTMNMAVSSLLGTIIELINNKSIAFCAGVTLNLEKYFYEVIFSSTHISMVR